MALGNDPQLATVDMHTLGYPGGGSDGTYIRTFLTDPSGRLYVNVNSLATPVGPGHFVTSQVATSTTAGTLAVARPTRTSVTFVNMDASITVYIGPATVTAGNGFPLLAGQSITLYTTALIQVIAASGTPTVAVGDEYN
jgi:hypothetical protein